MENRNIDTSLPINIEQSFAFPLAEVMITFKIA